MRSLRNINESVDSAKRAATQTLARAALQPEYRIPYDQYCDSQASSSVASQDPAAALAGVLVNPFNHRNSSLATPHQQRSNSLHQQPYGAGEDAGMTPHAAVLAVASGAPSQRSMANFVYPASHTADSGYPPYDTVTPNDWHHWSRANVQGLEPAPEYLHSATTLLTLGGRKGNAQGQEPDSTVDASALVQGQIQQWPAVQFNTDPSGQAG